MGGLLDSLFLNTFKRKEFSSKKLSVGWQLQKRKQSPGGLLQAVILLRGRATNLSPFGEVPAASMGNHPIPWRGWSITFCSHGDGENRTKIKN